MKQHSRLLQNKVKRICSTLQVNCRTSILSNIFRRYYSRKVVVTEVQATVEVVVRISLHF